MSEVDDLNHCIEELKEYKDLDEKRKVVVKTLGLLSSSRTLS
jgi:hypothetical protein